jgi:hypothetical protein
MLRCAVDLHPPQVAVLLTGDGAGYETGAGFHADLERLHKCGWGIEVLSWDLACGSNMKQWVKANGVYIKLEDYYDNVTFIEGGRNQKEPTLRNRPVAHPAQSR